MHTVKTKAGFVAEVEMTYPSHYAVSGLTHPLIGFVDDGISRRPWRWNWDGGSYASSNLYDLDYSDARRIREGK